MPVAILTGSRTVHRCARRRKVRIRVRVGRSACPQAGCDATRKRPRRLHGYERGARKQRPADHAVQVAVDPGDGVDAGEQATREAVGNTLHAEHQARERVVLDRLFAGRATEVSESGTSQGQGRWPAEPGSNRRARESNRGMVRPCCFLDVPAMQIRLTAGSDRWGRVLPRSRLF